MQSFDSRLCSNKEFRKEKSLNPLNALTVSIKSCNSWTLYDLNEQKSMNKSSKWKFFSYRIDVDNAKKFVVFSWFSIQCPHLHAAIRNEHTLKPKIKDPW